VGRLEVHTWLRGAVHCASYVGDCVQAALHYLGTRRLKRGTVRDLLEYAGASMSGLTCQRLQLRGCDAVRVAVAWPCTGHKTPCILAQKHVMWRWPQARAACCRQHLLPSRCDRHRPSQCYRATCRCAACLRSGLELASSSESSLIIGVFSPATGGMCAAVISLPCLL
jgi:hypothetical protein